MMEMEFAVIDTDCLESPQRQLGDCSGPAYKAKASGLNPPNGSWGIVQVRPAVLVATHIS